MSTMLARTHGIRELKPAPDLSSRAALSRCSGGLDRVGLALELTASYAPTPAERGTLEARRASLDQALQPASRDETQRLIAALFVGAIARDEGEETRQQIGLYAAEMARFPLWAVAAACRGYRDSGDPYRPPLGDLISRAKAACAATRAEAAQIGHVLEARIVAEPNPEERARVIAAFREKLRGVFEPKEGAA